MDEKEIKVYNILNPHLLLVTACFWGPQAEKVLQEYLQSRQSTSDAILQIDLALTQRQKEIEGEKEMDGMQDTSFYTF